MSSQSYGGAEDVASEGKPQRGRCLLPKLERVSRGLEVALGSELTLFHCEATETMVSHEKSQFLHRRWRCNVQSRI